MSELHASKRHVVRSYLFVPANRPERFAKACASGAHAVIIDLEDAVPANYKDAARAVLSDWLHPDHPVIVRINGVETPWFADDCALAAQPGVAGLMLPKAERIDEIAALWDAGKGRPILPLIETAVGFANVQQVAAARGVQRLAFGSVDFQLDVGIDSDGDELLMFRSGIVLASRLAGHQAPIDGVSTVIDDAATVRADADRARKLGFGAKLCIHPRQLDAVHTAFSPSENEIACARRVLHAASAADGAAVQAGGTMVDRPVMLRAQKILGDAGEREQQRGDRS